MTVAELIEKLKEMPQDVTLSWALDETGVWWAREPNGKPWGIVAEGRATDRWWWTAGAGLLRGGAKWMGCQKTELAAKRMSERAYRRMILCHTPRQAQHQASPLDGLTEPW